LIAKIAKVCFDLTLRAALRRERAASQMLPVLQMLSVLPND